MLLFGLIEISRLNVAKPCYLSKMSGEGNRFFSSFFFFFCCRLICVRVCVCFFCDGVCRLPARASVSLFRARSKRRIITTDFSEQPEKFSRSGAEISPVIFRRRRSYKGNADESLPLSGDTSRRRRSQRSAGGFRNSGDDVVAFSSFSCPSSESPPAGLNIGASPPGLFQ